MSEIIFTLVSRGFGWNLMREIFTSLDGAIFSLFSAVIQLMFDVASVTVKSAFFEDIQRRIYIILSIYMLFKVTVSLISYVVNPDNISDKSQGVGNLIQRILIAIIMLALIPTVFQKLTQYQSDIIEDHTIDNVILGAKNIKDQQNAGDDIGVAVYDGFIIRPRGKTLDKTASIGLKKVSDAVDAVNEPLDGHKDIYKYEYIPFIGFAMGVFMTILILSFCIDIAIRVFKLIILQLVAPIPIISYIDPKASKDGAFSKWIGMVVETWLSLFIRLVVIDFILLTIREFLAGNANFEAPTGIMVKVALVIGLLFFAKNLPQFIYDAVGIKSKPERGLFSGLGNIMAAGAIGAGVGLSAGQDFAGRLKTEGASSAFRNIGRSLFTGVGAGATGLATAASGKGMRDVNEARRKYLNNRMNHLSKGVQKDQFAHDRVKNVFDKASNLKKVMDDEAAKDNGYKLFAANVAAARNGDKNAINWLSSHSDADKFTRTVTSTKQVGTGVFGSDGKEIMRDETVTENIVDVAAASVYQEDLLHSIGDKLLADGSNGSINDAYSMYQDAANDAKDVRVDGEKIAILEVNSRSDAGKVQGYTGHIVNTIEQKSGYKGAGRRKS